MMIRIILSAIFAILSLALAQAHATPKASSPPATPDATARIIAAGRLRCGVIVEPLDWNKRDLHGNLSALDTAFCHAVASALFGRPDRVDLQSYTVEEEGLLALHEGRVDIVAGVTPGVMQAATRHIHFSLPIFEDAQGFMVNIDQHIKKLGDITNRKLCFIEDTDNDHIVMPYLEARGIRPIPFGFQEEGEMDAAIVDQHCQATSAMISKLAEARATLHTARNFVFLPDLLRLLPVTIAVPSEDGRLAAIVDYTISATLEAEFLGVTHANVMKFTHSADPRLQRLLGEDWVTAQALGLPHDWARKVILAVGNYAELYALTVGAATPYDLGRGLNALWDRGGVMMPLPMQ